MEGAWLGDLRAIARRMREALLEFFEEAPIPRSALEAKKVEEEADGVACRSLLEGLEETDRPCVLVCEDLGIRELGPKGGEKPFLVVDPLDGTRNFTRKLGIASISMAICDGPSLRHLKEALVLDIFTGREFWAIKGRGAFSDGREIRASRTKELSEALVSVDQSRSKKLGWVFEIVRRVDATRQLGSASMELCLVASGTLDAFVDLRDVIRPTDLAAGLLIAVEAGASAWLRGSSDPAGALRPDERVKLIVASQGIFDLLLEILRSYIPEGILLPAGGRPHEEDEAGRHSRQG